MTIGVADLLDMAISPEIGPVNFFHLRNLLHTIVDHFGISDIEAQQAEVASPGGYATSSESSEESSSEESDSEDESEGEQSEPEIQLIEEEVEKTIIDEDGNEQTVTVTVQKEVIKEPSEKKKDGESKKKNKDKDKDKDKPDKSDKDKSDKDKPDKDKSDKDKDKSERKDKKQKSEKSKSKSEKDVDEKEGKKHSSKGREKSAYGSSSKDVYGKPDKKIKLSSDTIGEMPEVINLTRRIDAVESGLKGLRNIIDSMVNQVDFGDGVGDILKAQLDHVQQQMNNVELIQKEEPKEKKKKKGKKGAEELPQSGIITEGGAVVVGDAVASGGVVTTAPGAPTGDLLPTVIPPPQRVGADTGKARTISRKDSRKGGVPLKGAAGNRAESQDDDKPVQKKRTILRDLQIKKKAREEGVSVEEIEAREVIKEAKKEQKDNENQDNQVNQDNKDNKEHQDNKDKKDSDADEASSMGSLDSAEEQEAMEEMLMEEIEAALENAADDPEAQAYALRLSIEQMNNMKKTLTQSQDEFRIEMSKNKTAIAQIARELSMFRASRKAQLHCTYIIIMSITFIIITTNNGTNLRQCCTDAEGFNAVHHVHSMVLELQTKYEKMSATTSELVDEYNRREKTFEEMVNSVERLQLCKADKQDVNQEINVKADKLDLDAKVSMNQFDEGFTLLDRGLSDALEKMENQMSVEDALKTTLTDLQSKLSLKLDRNDLESLRSQLESRINDIQIVKRVVIEKPEDGEPAGFRRNVTEKVHCISCDRLLEISKQAANSNPNIPKMQGLPNHKSAKPYTTYELEQIRQHQKMNGSLRKATINADLPYSAQKLRNEVVAMTGMVDIVDLPPSQRYCGGSHTIRHPFRRSVKSTSSHFNQYIMIREDVESNVALPRRDFIVPKDSGMKRYIKPKLPAIGQPNTRETSPPLDYDTYTDRPLSAPVTPIHAVRTGP
ncbi:hypothetical protein QZH41_013469 [Actinostola sp. cb2023]|nr:hypothetical protein QZH41_013469 [Actinostola sp. cb2023]